MLLKDNNWLSSIHTESTTTDGPDSVQTCIYTGPLHSFTLSAKDIWICHPDLEAGGL